MKFTFQVLNNLRTILSTIVDNHSLEELNAVPEGFNNNIIWNIGHVVVVEQLLIYKMSGLEPSIPNDIINKYKKDTKPEGLIDQHEVNIIQDLLVSTLNQTKTDYDNGVFKDYNAYTVSTTGNTLTSFNEALQFVLLHDGIHYGYILALLKAIKI
ncbi:DinB family protein [Mariniflexile ostreae]|uniref:DinB family protein n=1 Tax=Mariniflexile ostreae TaxID=1520892 RepID=A0ABV5F7V5_9FLAO